MEQNWVIVYRPQKDCQPVGGSFPEGEGWVMETYIADMQGNYLDKSRTKDAYGLTQIEGHGYGFCRNQTVHLPPLETLLLVLEFLS